MITFSNPRLTATFDNWPSGSKRVSCVLNVENGGKKGFRFTRQTTGKAKTATYGGKAAIVVGSDGRTYLIQKTGMSGMYNFITVRASDFMQADPAKLGFDPVVFPAHEQFDRLSALIELANCSRCLADMKRLAETR